MVKQRGECRARVFVVPGDVGDGDEVALHEVMTWPKLSDLIAFCERGESATSKQVVIGEMGGSFEGSMTMVVGEMGMWPVKLANDRMVAAPREGDVLTVLDSDWNGSGGARLWSIQPNVTGYIQVTPEGARYVPRMDEVGARRS